MSSDIGATSSENARENLLASENRKEDTQRWVTIKRNSRISLWVFYALMVVVVSIVIWRLVELSAEKHTIANASAALAVFLLVPLTLYDINAHIQNYVSPLQRFYIRIMFMVRNLSLLILFSPPQRGSFFFTSTTTLTTTSNPTLPRPGPYLRHRVLPCLDLERNKFVLGNMPGNVRSLCDSLRGESPSGVSGGQG